MMESLGRAVSFTHLVFVGLPGAGKSSVGRAVAGRLDLRFLDLDVIIERRAGRRIWEIFRDNGEKEFRRMERELTADLARERGVVLAPGGGWLLNDGVRALLGPSALLVYLRVDPATAAARLKTDEGIRPLLRDNPEESLRVLLASRTAAYESADHVVDTEGLGVQEVTEAVLRIVAPPGRSRA